MSVDTAELRRLIVAIGGYFPMTSEARSLLRSAADEIDELRKELETRRIERNRVIDERDAERSAHAETKRELNELRELGVIATEDLKRELAEECARRESAENALAAAMRGRLGQLGWDHFARYGGSNGQ